MAQLLRREETNNSFMYWSATQMATETSAGPGGGPESQAAPMGGRAQLKPTSVLSQGLEQEVKRLYPGGMSGIQVVS